MSQRNLAPGVASATHSHERHTLADLSCGQRAVIVGYGNEVEACTTRRLFDLGLMPGIEVKLIRRAPLRDPAVFRVGDYEIALRKSQSCAIYVELLS
jgi:ferrous iron transport protein A